jgi:hypothetical protein
VNGRFEWNGTVVRVEIVSQPLLIINQDDAICHIQAYLCCKYFYPHLLPSFVEYDVLCCAVLCCVVFDRNLEDWNLITREVSLDKDYNTYLYNFSFAGEKHEVQTLFYKWIVQPSPGAPL